MLEAQRNCGLVGRGRRLLVAAVIGFAVQACLNACGVNTKSGQTVSEQDSIKKRTASIDAQLLKVRAKLEKSDLLTTEDREFLVETANNNGLLIGNRAIALTILELASEKKLYSKSTLLELTEKEALSTPGTGSRVFLGIYALILGPQKPPEDKYSSELQGLLDKKSDLHSIDVEERSFVDRILRVAGDENRELAGILFVTKSGLSKQDLQWILARIDVQVKSKDDHVRAYWQCVSRLVKAKNNP